MTLFLRFLKVSAAASALLCLPPAAARADGWFGVGDALAAIDFPLTPSDADRLKAALAVVGRGGPALAETFAPFLQTDATRTALRWAALRRTPEPGLAALEAFLAAHPGWAGEGWIRAEIEAELFKANAGASRIRTALHGKAPETPLGQYALIRALRAEGAAAQATEAVRKLWREGADDPWLEGIIVQDCAQSLTRADDIARADRLIYAGRHAAAFRAAARAGADIAAQADIRIAAARGAPVPALAPNAALPPGLILAQASEARRAKRLDDAAAWLALAPTDDAALGDANAWWQERRRLVRLLLDAGEHRLAYDVAAGQGGGSGSTLSDAHFRAGWIALRFLNDAATAMAQFDASASAATDDGEAARGDYWRARALQAAGGDEAARDRFDAAAARPRSYYGQLAASALGRDWAAPPARLEAAEGEAREESVQAAEALFQAGQGDLALPLVFAALSRTRESSQAGALDALMGRFADPSAILAFGRVAMARGFIFEDSAFPVRGVPDAAPLALGAERPAVLAVMRQESGFIAHAASGAGAKGLMQMLPGTAREAAQRAGVAFDERRFYADPSFNVQLGGAYLGQLLQDLGGSMPIALAAYNAGPARVGQWLQTYGDPRNGQTDVVDWVERIPFDETRAYVQRVSEAVGVYRAKLAPSPEAGREGWRVARD